MPDLPHRASESLPRIEQLCRMSSVSMNRSQPARRLSEDSRIDPGAGTPPGGRARSGNRFKRVPIGVAFAWAQALVLPAGCTSESGEVISASPERRPAVPQAGATPRAPRHVILVIGDGMQMAHEVAASRYLFGEDSALSFHAFPGKAYVTTWDVTGYNQRASAAGAPLYSANSFDPKLGYDPALGGVAPYPQIPDSAELREYFLRGPYPDSASTATAISTGKKTDYGNIAWASGDREGGQLRLLSEVLRESGWATGLVTTVPISHATPAGFFAHNVSRSNYLEIGREILLESRPEVVIGGGVGPSRGGFVDSADLDQALLSQRWVGVERVPGQDGGAALQEAARRAIREEKGLIGIFGGREGNFESPVPSHTPGAPSLALGSIENPTLSDASLAALEVLSQDPDGFFLLVEQGDIDWANHANDFARMIGCIWDLDQAVRAMQAFIDRPGDALDWNNTMLLVTADHANSYLRFHSPLGIGALPKQIGASYPDGEVSYATTQHTAELVTLRLRGLGAGALLDHATDYPGLPIVDNTAIPQLILSAAR